ncbi:hypothetical protein ABK040_008427 [Willaertia magna]
MPKKSTRLTPVQRLEQESLEVEQLQQLVLEFAPPRGINPLVKTKKKEIKENETVDNSEAYKTITTFKELPISQYTKDALRKGGFTTMKDIQRATLLYSLCGRDILGAAKPGSGKTLAFIIPVIELLYRKKWGKLDGLGALILAPTADLATQIFEVLKLVGRFHHFSGGLLVGGAKNLKEEREQVTKMNILVATPGRLLQHMDETPNFNCMNLQILVLDEADRLLEMGFKNDINAILEGLPKKRQTLLFSATQTRDIKDLARLSLSKKNTEYISIHDDEVIPKKLIQQYIECELEDKIDILFSFIKSHLNNKMVIFVSTVKQVSFLYNVFKKLNINIRAFKLAGRMSQNSRREMYEGFTIAKSAVLFATDVASRGLDFPRVDFVLQMDAPISKKIYIHRVGRTARNEAQGKSIVFITPQEKEHLSFLFDGSSELSTLKEMKLNMSKIISIRPQLCALVSYEPELKTLALKYFESYLRHIYKHYGFDLDINSFNLNEFSMKLGLAIKPNLKFNPKDRMTKEERLNKSEDDEEEIAAEEADDSSSEEEQETEEKDVEMKEKVQEEEENQEEEDEDDEEDEKIRSKIAEIPIDFGDDEELMKHEMHAQQLIEQDEDNGIVYNVEYDPNASSSDDESSDEEDEEDDEEEKKEKIDDKEELLKLLSSDKKKKKKLTQMEKYIQSKKENAIPTNLPKNDEEKEEEEDFFVVKRKNHELDEKDDVPLYVNSTKKKFHKVDGKKHILFKEGKKISKFEALVKDLQNVNTEQITKGRNEYLEEVKSKIKQVDKKDKKLDKERIREKKEKKFEREKELEELRRKAEILEQNPFNYHNAVLPPRDTTVDEALPAEEQNVDESYENFVKTMEQAPTKPVSATQQRKERDEEQQKLKEKKEMQKRKFEDFMKEQKDPPKEISKSTTIVSPLKKEKKKKQSSLEDEEALALKLLEKTL